MREKRPWRTIKKELQEAIDQQDATEFPARAERYKATRDRADRDWLIVHLSLKAINAARRYSWNPDWQGEALLALVQCLDAGDVDGAIAHVPTEVRRFVIRDKIVRKHTRAELDESRICDWPDTRGEILEILKATPEEETLLELLETNRYRQCARTLGRSLGWVGENVKRFRKVLNRKGVFSPFKGRKTYSSNSGEDMTLSKDQPLIPLSKVPDYLQERGVVCTRSGVIRWIRKGIRGTRLQTCRFGGRIYTTADRIDAFYAAVQAA